MWESGNVVSKRCVVDLVNEDAEKSSSLVVGIGLELRVDVDDEGRRNSRKQTRLVAWLVHSI